LRGERIPERLTAFAERSAMSPIDFSEQEIAEQAEVNAGSLFFGTLAVLQDGGQSIGAWARGLGERFASSWEEVRSEGAFSAARWAALNMASTGAEIRSLEGDGNAAELVFIYPTGEAREFADELGVTEASVTESMAIWDPIMRYIDLRAESRQDGELRRLIVTRA
jgi:hypothetical protein